MAAFIMEYASRGICLRFKGQKCSMHFTFSHCAFEFKEFILSTEWLLSFEFTAIGMAARGPILPT